MKKYKLLKGLPFAKAGEEFQLHRGGINDYITLYRNKEQIYQFKVGENVSEMFDEWFEEEKKIYFTIDFFRKEIAKVSEKEIMGYAIDNVKSLGMLFETQEKAEKHLKYLQAKEVIKQDTKGFKPNWNDENERKYYGYWNFENNNPDWKLLYISKENNIYFKSSEDIKESFEKHPEEWKKYLTYEQ